MKKRFATHGTRRQFAKEEGFKCHKVTPLHARVNGEAESFMKMMNKTEPISHLETRRTRLQENPAEYADSVSFNTASHHTRH
jgi:hypothetical protein